jgi:hypothetical protein
VTSRRQCAANRLNARASTGPTSAAGRARAARNAVRHGLSLPVLADPSLAAQAEALARAMAGANASPRLLDLARRVAEAQLDLARVRRARHDLMSRAGADGWPVAPSPVGRRLAAIDRYERRSLSRRKFAVRAYDAAQALLAAPPQD